MFAGKEMHKRLMASFLGLVAMTSQVLAQNVTVYNGIYNANPALLRVPWYGSQAAAQQAATQFGANSANATIGYGAFFAYDSFAQVCAWNILSNSVLCPGGAWNTTTSVLGWAVSSTEPEAATPPGPNAVTTYQSLQTADNQTRVAMQQRYAVMTTVLDYDCAKFDKYGICLSFEARGVGFGAMNTGAGVIKASYRLMDKVHAGVFLDYQAGGAEPSLPSITNGSVQFGYDNATFGGFVGYNTLMGHTGFEARVTGAYNPGKVNIQRALLVANEAGGGLAGLNASGVYGQVGYGFPIIEGVVITPFLGIRYTDVTRNAYTEQANTLVLYPIGYNNFTQSVVTGLGGGRINGKIIDKLGYEIGGGIEGDYSRSLNAFSGYSYINYVGEFSLPNNDTAWNAIRPFGLAGLTYDITPNQRLTANTTVREQPYSTRSYMSGLVGYQVSF